MEEKKKKKTNSLTSDQYTASSKSECGDMRNYHYLQSRDDGSKVFF